MKKYLIFSAILLKGFTSVISQTLLMRELLIVFYGNELTFGFILSLWLMAGAIGSGFIGNLFKTSQSPLRPYCFFQFVLSLYLPLAIIFIRTSKTWLHVSSAEVLTLYPIIAVSGLGLILPSLCDGAMFNMGLRLIQPYAQRKESSIAKIYLLESLGIIVGGFAFTFILLKLLNSFQIIFILSSLNLFCLAFLLRDDKNTLLKIGSAMAALATLFLLSQSQRLQDFTLRKQWQKKDIVAYENSIYGNIAVAKELNQYTLFYDGLPTVSIPNPETYFTEDFIHLPLLAKSEVKKILFIGTAAGGLLKEALKYPLEKAVYVEMDPAVIKILTSLKEPSLEQELKDPRVAIRLTDGRNYIKTTQERFDAVFVNIGLATSLALNRYYTKEFFQEIQKALAPNGIAVFKTWGSLSYLSNNLKKINAVLLVTLKNVFPYLEIIPGDGFNIFIASQQRQNFALNFLTDHLMKLNLKTTLINPSYVAIRLQQPYRQWFDISLKDDLRQAAINQDLKPTGLYEGLGLYYAQFSKKIPRLFSALAKVKPRTTTLNLIAFLLLWRFFIKHKKIARATLSFTVFSTGLFAMSVQIIVLFLFQSLLGYLFHWLAILTTSFMIGASLGAYYANKKIEFLSLYKKLAQTEIILPTISVLIIFGTVALFNHQTGSYEILRWLFSLISISAGLLVGLQLPLVYELYLKTLLTHQMTSSHIAGKLYGLDLIGACMGAILAPLILIPSCGILATTFILYLLKIGNGWNVLRLQDKI